MSAYHGQNQTAQEAPRVSVDTRRCRVVLRPATSITL